MPFTEQKVFDVKQEVKTIRIYGGTKGEFDFHEWISKYSGISHRHDSVHLFFIIFVTTLS